MNHFQMMMMTLFHFKKRDMKAPKKEAYIEFSHWDQTVRITLDHHDIDLDEAFEAFKRLLMASGFSEQQIDEYLNEGNL